MVFWRLHYGVGDGGAGGRLNHSYFVCSDGFMILSDRAGRGAVLPQNSSSEEVPHARAGSVLLAVFILLLAVVLIGHLHEPQSRQPWS